MTEVTSRQSSRFAERNLTVLSLLGAISLGRSVERAAALPARAPIDPEPHPFDLVMLGVVATAAHMELGLACALDASTRRDPSAAPSVGTAPATRGSLLR